MSALWILAAAVAGYVLGSVSFAVIVARRHGVDILKAGSGNPGATNVKRVIGKRAGNLVFVLDFFKGLVGAGWPGLVAALGVLQADNTTVAWMGLAGLAGAIAGHSFSMFLGFRGGKGVATAIGGLAALMPLVILGGVVVWLAVFYATRYVSLASILLGVSLAPLAYVLHRPAPQVGFCILLGVVILVRHRANIQRLCQGKEHKFEKKEPEPKNVGKEKAPAYVIGAQLAAAREVENERLKKGPTEQSPMEGKKYDPKLGEMGLYATVSVPLDDTLKALTDKFAVQSTEARTRMRAAIAMDELYTLIHFAKRAAVFALRTKSPDWVAGGLTAIAMVEMERTDYRDILTTLSLLSYSAGKIGEDTVGLFQEAAAMAELNTAKCIERFVREPVTTPSLRNSWGQDEVETRNGKGFIHWDMAPYHPTYDLKVLALEIADQIAADKYLPSPYVAIASKLPAVWLKTEGDDRLEVLLNGVLGGASIPGSLRPGEHRDYQAQQLSIFLVEMRNEAEANELLQCSLPEKPRKTSCVLAGIASGPLFCLVVARAFVTGTEAFETTESLKRFVPGIQVILNRRASV